MYVYKLMCTCQCAYTTKPHSPCSAIQTSLLFFSVLTPLSHVVHIALYGFNGINTLRKGNLVCIWTTWMHGLSRTMFP